MSKFTFENYQRYDETVAEEGQPYTAIDEYGRVWGIFTVRWMDEETTHGINKIIAANERGKVMKEEGKSDDYIGAHTLATEYLVGWDIAKEITGGKKLVFNTENAIEFLCARETAWLVTRLLKFARNMKNFNPNFDSEGKRIDLEKNS